MQLDPPPLLPHLLLESPWALMVVFAVLGVILLTTAHRKRQKSLLIASIGCLGVAVGVYMLAQSVVTPREQLLKDTKSLVYATAPLDSAVLERMIAPSAVVTGPDGSVWVEAGQIRSRLEHVLKRVPIDQQQIRSLDAATQDEQWGYSTVTVRTHTGSNPVNTGWRLTWRHESDGRWRVVDIRWMRFNGMDTPQGILP